MSHGPSESLSHLDVRDPVVCFCNDIRLSVVVRALESGAHTLPTLIDRTWAGCGPCGGTCQEDLRALLTDFLSEEPDQ